MTGGPTNTATDAFDLSICPVPYCPFGLLSRRRTPATLMRLRRHLEEAHAGWTAHAFMLFRAAWNERIRHAHLS